jgi:hypothetical protein
MTDRRRRALVEALENAGVRIVGENERGQPVDANGRAWWCDRLTRPGAVRLRWAKDGGEHGVLTRAIVEPPNETQR